MNIFSLLPKRNSELVDYETAYKTWCLVADTTLTAPAASIDVTSIPAGYRLYYMFVHGSLTIAANSCLIKFNNDSTAGHYKIQYLNAAAGVVSSGSQLNRGDSIWSWFGLTYPGSGAGYVNNELGKAKTHVIFGGQEDFTYYISGIYTDAGAEAVISRITFSAAANNLNTGTRIIIMGLK